MILSTTLNELMDGYKLFLKNHSLQASREAYIKFQQGQYPKAVVIGCSDSRVDPCVIFQQSIGDLFVIRNVANIVPPYTPTFDDYHGTSAALEFAINHLHIDHIIVMGHSNCGGIQALLNEDQSRPDNFIDKWISILNPAKEKALACIQESQFPSKQSFLELCTQESIILSVANLLSYPWIKEKYERNQLNITGMIFHLKYLSLKICSPENKVFQKINQ